MKVFANILTLTLLIISFSASIADKKSDLNKLFSNGKTEIPESKMVKQMRKTSEDGFFVNQVGSLMFNKVEQGSTPAQTYGKTALDPQYCPFVNPICNFSYPYRTIDGTCNNINWPLYGSANIPFKRFLPPAYNDGFNSPRVKSLSGKNLTHPRIISLIISPTKPDSEKLDDKISQVYSIFGQFIIHDFLLTSAITDQNNIELDCPCGSTSLDCFSLDWPLNDPYINHTCLKLTRSSSSPSDLNCSIDYREQLNLLSAYPDGTQIYGLDSERVNRLRSFSNGLLITSEPVNPMTKQIASAQNYLSLANETCSSWAGYNYKCFLAGESRTSENLALVSMHTLFQREHNRIATELSKLNPNWDDETLYQESKKIVLGIYQHIIYNEWVPIVNGNLSLMPIMNSNQYYNGYDSSINPSLYNEFATAAFRFGHSLIRDIFKRYDSKGKELKPIYFYDMNFKSDYAYDAEGQGINSLLRGVIKERGWVWGSFGFDMQNRLEGKFENNIFTAIDLLAKNILRGRDHGLQPYIKYVKYCHNIDITKFDDLRVLMSSKSVDKLRSVYVNVGDIDLYAGGLMEDKASKFHSTGRTFGCLIMKQFTELKNGDRFYYENGPDINPSAFRPDQLAEIKKVTMAGLICNNYDFDKIQKKVFFISDSSNVEVNCTTLRSQINLSLWLE